jgi:hypothetical protein
MKTIAQQVLDGELNLTDIPQKQNQSFDYQALSLDFTSFKDGSIHLREFFFTDPSINVAVGFKNVAEAANFFDHSESKLKNWLLTQFPAAA